MKEFIKKWTLFILVLCSLLSISGYFGRWNWIADLTVHFRLQYLVVLLLGILVLALTSKRKLILLFVPFVLVNALEVVAVYFPSNDKITNQVDFKVLLINLYSLNQEDAKVLSLIEEKDPDLIVLQEYTPKWNQALSELDDLFEDQVENIRNDNFGIALFSKLPLQNEKILNLGDAEKPSIQIEFPWKDKTVKVLATHPLPPVDKRFFEHRNRQLVKISDHFSAYSKNLLLLGDLNTSPYSFHFKKIKKELSLKDTRKGKGIHNTWPQWFRPLFIPLDHCFIGESLYCSKREVLESVGSDHLPVYLEIGLLE